MARLTARLAIVALVGGLGIAPVARADDTELFAKANVQPHVLIALDTSQSMTWFNKDGGTVGDEFCLPSPSDSCPPTDPMDPSKAPLAASRMWTAKNVLSTIVTKYGDKVNFGLAGFQQGDATQNVALKTAAAGAPMSWYYAEGWSKIPFGWQAYTFGNRYYLWPQYFDLRTPQAGLGGPADPADPAGYNPATLRPNSPSFTLRWHLRSDVSPNPQRQFSAGRPPRPPSPGSGHYEGVCGYGYDRSYDDRQTWAPDGSYWQVAAAGPCPDAGTVTGADEFVPGVDITWPCDYKGKKKFDHPKPYDYKCTQKNKGNPAGPTRWEEWQDYRGDFYWGSGAHSTPDYWRHVVSRGGTSKWVWDVAPDPGDPGSADLYRWVYFYDASCGAFCKNTGRFWRWQWQTPWYPDDATCKAGQVNNPFTDPPAMGLPACGSPWRNASNQPVWAPSNTGAWGVPYDAEYRWQGNNYRLITDTSCADPNNGGQVLVDVGSGTQAAIKDYLGTGTDPAKELHAANVSTPLAGALSTAYNYFADDNGVVRTDALKECRRNYVLLVTDGGEACLTDLTLPGQKAAALAALADPPGGVKTYVVGLDPGGLSSDEQTVLNDIAARGGTNNWFRASTMGTLTAAIETILGEILSQTYSFASIIVPRMRLRDNLMAVQAAMLPNTAPNVPFWKGYVAAYKLNDDGTIPLDANNLVDPGSAVKYWEASAVLDGTSPGARRMYLTLFDWTDPDPNNWGYKMVEFKADPRVYAALGCPGGSWVFDGTQWAFTKFPDVNEDGRSDLNDCPAFVNLLRGSNAHNWGSKLGDIFHSQPVVVGSPSPTYVDTTFDPGKPGTNLPFSAAPNTFKPFQDAKSTRTRIVLVGANDGFLHAFNAGNWDAATSAYDTGTGKEEWAFAPYQLASSLQSLGNKKGAHRYFVDGTAKVADVWLDDNDDGTKAPDGSEWHTVLLMNLRQGGQGIFHLDITDTRNPRPISDGANYYPPYWGTCGQSWSEPAIGKVKLQVGGRKVDRWVAFFGDGNTAPYKLDPSWSYTAWCGKRFFAVDLKTGRYILYLYNRRLFGGPTDETQYMTHDMVGSPIALDTDGDGYVDRVYIADRGGQIWRLDVSAVGSSGGADWDPNNWWSTMVDNWSLSRAFVAPSTRTIYEKPAAAFDSLRNLWLFAGTGDRLNPLAMDPPDPVTPGKGRDGRLYGIKDTYVSGSPAPAPWTDADLEDVTGANTIHPSDLAKPGGWMIKLDRGEKTFAGADAFNRVVYFSTLVPEARTSGLGCSTSPATARLYMLYYLTGGGVTDAAAFQGAPPAPSARSVDLGAGAPIRTVISTLTLGGSAVALTGTTEQRVYIGKGPNAPGYRDFVINAPNNLRFTRYWRQNP